jgi:alkaline phosphatase D
VRFAFWSCQDYTHGYYNAHERMANEDLDFVVCLGDYIYDETYHTVKDGTGVRDDKTGRAQQESGQAGVNYTRAAETLDQYRDKYALYRSDASLRKMQSRFPVVMLWDDHEVQDDYAGGAPGGGLPASHHYSRKRQAAAYRAFFETMPYTPPSGQPTRIYRRLQFGRTVDLLVMDQRQYRADQPCDDATGVPACADYNQPRRFLGTRQMDWLKSQLNSSKAAWKVMANEVVIMPTRVLGGAFFGFDGWDGYPQEREELLTHIRDRQIKDVVFVTGDIHTFIAGDVKTNAGAGDPAAIEFVGGSITSSGLGETDLPAGGGTVIKGNDKDPHTDPAIIDALKGINPWVDSADFDHHGYGKVVATKDAFDCEMVRMKTIKKKTTSRLPASGMHYHVARGQQSIKGTSL